MLNYRRDSLEKLSETHRERVKPFVRGEQVVVMDNRLDAYFRELPAWFGDRHPNPAGYHVIGDETARFLAKRIRGKEEGESSATARGRRALASPNLIAHGEPERFPSISLLPSG